MKINFVTPTSMDLDYMLVMGLSAKENDNAIGRFGTGFKYAVAKAPNVSQGQ